MMLFRKKGWILPILILFLSFTSACSLGSALSAPTPPPPTLIPVQQLPTLFPAQNQSVVTAIVQQTPIVAEKTSQTLPPTPPVSQTLLPADVLFSDNFSNPASGWDTRNEANAITDYRNGEFVIFVGNINTTLWSIPNHYLKDASIEVDAREAAGPDNNLFGLICRYQNANNFYRFVISGNGYAGITKRVNGVVKVLSGDLLSRSPAVNKGQATNHLKAVCNGSDLSFYVNEQLVSQVQDGDLADGDAGLLASTGVHPGVEIHFTNFVARKP